MRQQGFKQLQQSRPQAQLPNQPTMVRCQYCRHQNFTIVQKKCGSAAIFYGIVLGLTTCIGCIFPISGTCNDKHHQCASCGNTVGIFQYPVY